MHCNLFVSYENRVQWFCCSNAVVDARYIMFTSIFGFVTIGEKLGFAEGLQIIVKVRQVGNGL